MNDSQSFESADEIRKQINGAIEPSDIAELQVRLGCALAIQGNHQDALAMLENAIQIDMDNAVQNQAFLRAAIEAYYCGDYEKSIRYFQHNMPAHLTPADRINATIVYADSLARANHFEEALEKYADAAMLLGEISGIQRIQAAKDIQEKSLYAAKLFRKAKSE